MLIDPVELRIFVYTEIASNGVPPAIATISAHFHVAAGDARQSLASLDIGKTILVHPHSGEIWMAGPFASSPTSYVVVGSRARWWANCGWDMLGVPAIVGEPVIIHAACTDCGEQMQITADPLRGVAGDGVVHFLVPAGRWYDDIGFT